MCGKGQRLETLNLRGGMQEFDDDGDSYIITSDFLLDDDEHSALSSLDRH